MVLKYTSESTDLRTESDILTASSILGGSLVLNVQVDHALYIPLQVYLLPSNSNFLLQIVHLPKGP